MLDGSTGANLCPPVQRGYVLVGVQDIVTASMTASEALGVLRKHAKERPLALTFCAPGVSRPAAAGSGSSSVPAAPAGEETLPRTESAKVRADMVAIKASAQPPPVDRVIELDDFLAARAALQQVMAAKSPSHSQLQQDEGETFVHGCG